MFSLPGRQKKKLPPKRLHVYTKLHGVTCHTNGVAAMRVSETTRTDFKLHWRSCFLLAARINYNFYDSTFIPSWNSGYSHYRDSVNFVFVSVWNAGCFKKIFSNLEAHIHLFRGHVQCFESSYCSKTHRVLPGIVTVQCDSLVMRGVSERALQWYSKCYCVANVTRTFTLKGVQTIHPTAPTTMSTLYAFECKRSRNIRHKVTFGIPL
jgi:hypothetical protein